MTFPLLVVVLGLVVGDQDADGVVDVEDRCPELAGPRENQGCPEIDGDGDGVVDRLDRCPAEAGTGADGCVAAREARLEVRPMYFERGVAEPRALSVAMLGAVAHRLDAHPEWAHVRIECLADDGLAPAAETSLAESRAAAVSRLLVARGVDARRLLAVGTRAKPARVEAERAAHRRCSLSAEAPGR